MKIPIPKEYIDVFPSEEMWIKFKEEKCCENRKFTAVYVSRWKGYSLLVLGVDDYNKLISHLHTLTGVERGISRFIEAGFVATRIENDTIGVPEAFATRLKGHKRTYEKTKNGLVIR